LITLTGLSLVTRPLAYCFESPRYIAFDAIGLLGVWITTLIILFGVPGSGHQYTKKPNKSEQATPTKPSD